MKPAVIYYSLTGSTKKIAETIASVFGIEAQSVKDKADISDSDLILFGSGCYANKPGKEMIAFLENIDISGKKAAVFGTYSLNEAAIDLMESKLKEKGAKIIRKWGCKGKMFGLLGPKPDIHGARIFAESMKEQVSNRKIDNNSQ
ncbi:MAG: flavodoxin domain-containing protein [Nanoarchaeota archaeon]|nr:flavodoxin domain-containing protein [Nanoarchaeota archaeon]